MARLLYWTMARAIAKAVWCDLSRPMYYCISYAQLVNEFVLDIVCDATPYLMTKLSRMVQIYLVKSS